MKCGYLVVPKTKDRESEDVVDVFEISDIKIFILCDGAGGYGGGLEAATEAVKCIRQYITEYFECFDKITSHHKNDIDAVVNSSIMNACEQVSGIGQSTCIVLAICDDRVICSSVGDSKAYLFGSKTIEMTANQVKTRLGNSSFPSCGYYQFTDKDYIVIGSDGLWNFVKMEKIEHLIKYREIDDALKLAYEDAVKFESFDDFSMILIKN
jgi:serine/threonine protein phosphatase PrpC